MKGTKKTKEQLLSEDEIVAIMRNIHGLDVSAYDATFLVKALEKRRVATSTETALSYMELLSEDPAEAETFLHSLSVTYSKFFRNPLTFGLLEQVILPGLVSGEIASAKRDLRIWSAGCAGGQEAWSIAILLEEMIATWKEPFSYRIFASDRSEEILALARSGVYSPSDLGNVRLRQLERYFSKQGDSYAILPKLKEQIDFSTHDLLNTQSRSPSASIYGDFDLVICSNLLFYYKPEMQRFILDKLRQNLTTGGYLVTGETEQKNVESILGLTMIAPAIPIFQIATRRR